MKKTKLCILVAGALCLSGCQKDDCAQVITVSTGDVANITGWSADIAGVVQVHDDNQTYVSDPSVRFEERGICWNTTGEPTRNDDFAADNAADFGAFVCTADNLSCGTTYFVRTYVKSGRYLTYGEEKTFTTPDLAQVETGEAKSVTGYTALIECKILSDGGSDVQRCGVLYSNYRTPQQGDKQVVGTLENGVFQCALTSLQHTTTYYVRAFAETAAGIAYGNTVSFATLRMPVVLTKGFADRTENAVTVIGQVTDNGGEEITECGICYNTTGQPSVKDGKLTHTATMEEFRCTITSMEHTQPYYARAYAVNTVGISYGDVLAFYWKPTVTTLATTNVAYTTATCNGNVVSNGGRTVTECGICYSTESEPTIDDRKAVSATTMGTYVCQLTGLQAGTTYHCRAYAVNAEGVSYGGERTFITLAYTLPNVQTGGVSNVGHTSATCAANVLSDGGQAVTERGICYALSSNPTTADSKITVGAGTGSFTATLSDLQAGQTYHYRAYAVSAQGTAYGEERTFDTQAYSVPSVQTGDAANITYSSAQCSGTVLSDGGQAVSVRGICYSVSPNPTIENTCARKGNGVGTFTATLNNLKIGKTYYYRAYATNALGTTYGEERSFTTQNTFAGIIPSGTTFTSQNITFKAAKGSGTVEPAYFENYQRLRVYAKGIFTISSSVYTIHSIAITTDQPDLLANLTPNTGTVSLNADRTIITWTGSASNVVLKLSERNINDTNPGRLSIQSIDVVVEEK